MQNPTRNSDTKRQVFCCFIRVFNPRTTAGDIEIARQRAHTLRQNLLNIKSWNCIKFMALSQKKSSWNELNKKEKKAKILKCLPLFRSREKWFIERRTHYTTYTIPKKIQAHSYDKTGSQVEEKLKKVFCTAWKANTRMYGSMQRNK